MLTIDGSMGEGGGQILRSALALSLCSGKPFRIHHLRARRKKPGLRNQHLVSVNAATKIGDAKVKGAVLGSKELTFVPGSIREGDYSFDIGTAGSTTLVLQSVLPALMIAPGPSTLTLMGGTHNPLAPPFDFVQRVLLPMINRMGAQVKAHLERPGYYPKGGGKFRVTIHPAKKLRMLHIQERGRILKRLAVAVVAGLPVNIAERELEVVGRVLGWGPECLHVREDPPERGPGNVVSIEIESQYITDIFTGFGIRGVQAERVAEKVSRTARCYLDAGVPVGEFLADQLLLPFALAGGGSFKTLKPTSHTTTNARVIKLFVDISISIDRISSLAWKVTLLR